MHFQSCVRKEDTHDVHGMLHSILCATATVQKTVPLLVGKTQRNSNLKSHTLLNVTNL